MNIRTINPESAADAALRASLQTQGWRDTEPAIVDEHGTVLRGNRRMAIAKELGIEPVTVTITFGDGPEADKQRLIAATVSNIGRKEMALADRKRLAALFYEAGMTMAQIGAMFGVAEKTISRDLADSDIMSELKPRQKTDQNPKGAGRPKGIRQPKLPLAPRTTTAGIGDTTRKIRAQVRPLVERGAPIVVQEVMAATGHSRIVTEGAIAAERGRLEGIREAAERVPVDVSTLGKTARERLDALEQRLRTQLDAEFERRVRDEVRQRLAARDADDVLAIEQANELIREQTGRARKPLTAQEYYQLLWALHPDTRDPAKVTAAFIVVRQKKLVLCDDGPIRRKSADATPLPRTVDDLLRMREARRTARSAS